MYYDAHINGIRHRNVILAYNQMENDNVQLLFGKNASIINQQLQNNLEWLCKLKI